MYLLLAVAVAVAVILLCGCLPVEDAPAASGHDEVAAVERVPRENGMPLDAIEYDPPAWMPWCGRAYMVCDRKSGQQWWLLVMENRGMDVSYVVLPLNKED